MPDEHMFSDSCQVLEQRLTAAERQAIRDHARAAADAMGAAAAAIMERWPKLSGVDEVALQRAVADAWRIRALADALEPGPRHG
jgi:hypothetical protein